MDGPAKHCTSQQRWQREERAGSTHLDFLRRRLLGGGGNPQAAAVGGGPAAPLDPLDTIHQQAVVKGGRGERPESV